MAYLTVIAAVWIPVPGVLPLTEASLHVTELVWFTLVIRLTGSAALVVGEAAQIWVVTDAVAVAWANVHVPLF